MALHLEFKYVIYSLFGNRNVFVVQADTSAFFFPPLLLFETHNFCSFNYILSHLIFSPRDWYIGFLYSN